MKHYEVAVRWTKSERGYIQANDLEEARKIANALYKTETLQTVFETGPAEEEEMTVQPVDSKYVVDGEEAESLKANIEAVAELEPEDYLN